MNCEHMRLAGYCQICESETKMSKPKCGITHHTGCDCHEANWQAQLAAVTKERDEVRKLNDEIDCGSDGVIALVRERDAALAEVKRVTIRYEQDMERMEGFAKSAVREIEELKRAIEIWKVEEKEWLNDLRDLHYQLATCRAALESIRDNNGPYTEGHVMDEQCCDGCVARKALATSDGSALERWKAMERVVEAARYSCNIQKTAFAHFECVGTHPKLSDALAALDASFGKEGG